MQGHRALESQVRNRLLLTYSTLTLRLLLAYLPTDQTLNHQIESNHQWSSVSKWKSTKVHWPKIPQRLQSNLGAVVEFVPHKSQTWLGSRFRVWWSRLQLVNLSCQQQQQQQPDTLDMESSLLTSNRIKLLSLAKFKHHIFFWCPNSHTVTGSWQQQQHTNLPGHPTASSLDAWPRAQAPTLWL